MGWMTDSVVRVKWDNKVWTGYVHEACVNREMLQLTPPGSFGFTERPDMTCPVCAKPIEVNWQE